MRAGYASETMEAAGQWNDIFQFLNDKELRSKISISRGKNHPSKSEVK